MISPAQCLNTFIGNLLTLFLLPPTVATIMFVFPMLYGVIYHD
jgi:hypothetical protein